MSNREELESTEYAIKEAKRALRSLKALRRVLKAADNGWLPQSPERAAAKRATLDASKAFAMFRRRRS
ncbi:hypothetical protein CPT_Seuss55 [Caulobacter phage Seuss]|uniref:Uncharacterized protein n=1 Tax=Caulobacter phage Seuss TaxID=1675601 RepID=A0A0K1LM52_9CAUD|nr:hypothetical protein HOR08_gp055 [Caulobacter phage Seuss]AKU43581.1 hypothetical protein CPT_Seuss55 [Caulobacter phage Seuss]